MSRFTGFKLQSKSTSSTYDNAKPQQTLNPHSSLASKAVAAANYPKRHATEEDYFEGDDDDELASKKSKQLEYQPASDSSSSEEEEEEDPLDSFMSGINKEAKKDLERVGQKQDKKENKGTRDDIEGEDDQESFFKWMEENPNAGIALNDDDEQDLDYDEEGNIIVPEKSKVCETLI